MDVRLLCYSCHLALLFLTIIVCPALTDSLTINYEPVCSSALVYSSKIRWVVSGYLSSSSKVVHQEVAGPGVGPWRSLGGGERDNPLVTVVVPSLAF